MCTQIFTVKPIILFVIKCYFDLKLPLVNGVKGTCISIPSAE